MGEFSELFPKPSSMDEEEYISALYEYFLSHVCNAGLDWKPTGRRLSLRRRELVDGRHYIFWHVISEEGPALDDEHPGREGRILCHDRCKRIHFIRRMVDEFNSIWPQKSGPAITWWKSPRANARNRYIISLHDFSYAVVLDERSEYTNLVTAYYIERPHRRRKNQQEHAKYWEGVT